MHGCDIVYLTLLQQSIRALVTRDAKENVISYHIRRPPELILRLATPSTAALHRATVPSLPQNIT
jgi:hypothetical protein